MQTQQRHPIQMHQLKKQQEQEQEQEQESEPTLLEPCQPVQHT
jgi:hypothetical protein